MPEKKEHADLRKIIKKWVKSNLDSYCLTIIDDDPRNPLGSSVPGIRGSIPDLYGRSFKHGIQVIGEAKTSNDIINKEVINSERINISLLNSVYQIYIFINIDEHIFYPHEYP